MLGSLVNAHWALDEHTADGSILSEHLTDLLLRDVVGKATDVQVSLLVMA